MAITATQTQIHIQIAPNLPGSVSGHSWTALVGPVRYRDRAPFGGPTAWAGKRCHGTILPCPSNTWAAIESGWSQVFGGSVTMTRSDTDWLPGDQVCEGTASKTSDDATWMPSPGEISIPGSCVALPDPKPTPPPSCSLSTPTTLAHGNLAVAAVQGATAAASATLLCNANMTVAVKAFRSTNNPTSTVPVRADNSITSHLTVNGADGATGTTISAVANRPVAIPLASILTTSNPTDGALQGSAVLIAGQLQKPLTINGNVLAAATAPRAVLSMTMIANAQSNLGVTWAWSTTTVDYGSDLVPANHSVGLFIRNAAQTKWSAFRTDTSAATAAGWAQRIQRFHDQNAGGGIREPGSRIFESGTWCVTLAAASTAETGGVFLPAPGAAESCVTVP